MINDCAILSTSEIEVFKPLDDLREMLGIDHDHD